jgi:hypothetical protein
MGYVVSLTYTQQIVEIIIAMRFHKSRAARRSTPSPLLPMYIRSQRSSRRNEQLRDNAVEKLLQQIVELLSKDPQLRRLTQFASCGNFLLAGLGLIMALLLYFLYRQR